MKRETGNGKRLKAIGIFGLFFTFSVLRFPFRVSAAGDPENGKALYMKSCAQCHGDNGDGQGPAAERLMPKPRDFTSGAYKIRSTPNGELPTEQDIFNAIAKGLPGSSMPSWRGVFKDKEIWDLTVYLRSFNDRFKDEKPSRIFEAKNSKKLTPESILEGRKIYAEIQCFQCHGLEGRADGPSAPTMVDDLGNPIRPANFHKGWKFRGGHSREDIFRTLLTGLNGSPMPSSLDALGDSPQGMEKAWHLVNYIYSLSPDKPDAGEVARAKKVSGPLPASPSDSVWQSLKPVDFILVGQIMEEPRLFNPSVDRVMMRALYNDKEVAMLLEWDDPVEDRALEKGTLPDQIQLQFPWSLIKDSQDGERPYFLEGDLQHPVALLHWDSKTDKISYLRGRGMAAAKEPIQADIPLISSAGYSNGLWQLVIKRPLAIPQEAGPSLEPGSFYPIAFSAWNGSNQETGPVRSVSSWYYLLLEPEKSNTVYTYPVGAFLFVGAVEFWFLRSRKKKRSKKNKEGELPNDV